MTKLKDIDALPERLGMDEALATASACIQSVLDGGPSAISNITQHLSANGGKAIRLRLLLAAAMDEKSEVPRDAVSAAAAVELFHLATLVHDDIIDDAPLRRGIASVQSKFGKKAAVIGGDYLLCLAMSVMAPVYQNRLSTDAGVVPAVSNLLMQVCLGEYRQHTNQGNYEVSVYDYLKTISGKTAALFTLSAYVGAVLGDCDEKQAKALARFGSYVGMIFQIIDDCKDYEFSEETALKTVRHDAAEGVATLPLILALAKSPGLGKMAAEVMAGAGADVLIQEVCRLGGVSEARATAERYGKKAARVIGSLVNEPKKAALGNVLRHALGS